jgi:hypothetical protein
MTDPLFRRAGSRRTDFHRPFEEGLIMAVLAVPELMRGATEARARAETMTKPELR